MDFADKVCGIVLKLVCCVAVIGVSRAAVAFYTPEQEEESETRFDSRAPLSERLVSR